MLLKQVSDRWSDVAEMARTTLLDEHNQPQWLSAQYRDVVMSRYGTRSNR